MHYNKNSSAPEQNIDKQQHPSWNREYPEVSRVSEENRCSRDKTQDSEPVGPCDQIVFDERAGYADVSEVADV